MNAARRIQLLEEELTQARAAVSEAQIQLQKQLRLARRIALQRDVLADIARRASSGQPLEEMLKSVVRHAAELTGAEGAAFARVLPPGNEVETSIAWGRCEQFLGKRMPLDDSWTREVVVKGLDALDESPHLAARAHAEALRRADTRSLIVVPLRVQGRAAGVLFISSHFFGSAELPPEEIDFLNAFAAQVALILSEGVAYQQVERRVQQLAALNELGLALVQAEQRDCLLALIVERVVRALDIPLCFIAEADWERGTYHLIRDSCTVAKIPSEFPINEGSITGRALIKARPQQFVHRPDLSAVAQFGIECEYNSLMSAPLPGGGSRPAGAITVGAQESHRFDENDLHFLEAVAAYLAVAQTQVQKLDHLFHELEQLDAVIEQVGDPILVIDPNINVVRANQAVRAISGLANPVGAQAMLLREALSVCFSDGQRLNAPHPAVDAVRSGERVDTALLQVTSADGRERWMNTTFTPIRDAAGRVRYIVVVGQDGAEQQRVERAKDEFLSVVSHELKTPLTAIKGFAQLAVKQGDKVGLPASLQRALQLIDQETNRMTGLVNELLDVSRLQLGRLKLSPSRVDAVALCRRVVERVQGFSPSHEIRFQCSDAEAWGTWDAPRLEQVVANLLDNAAKYQPQGGPIDLHLTLEEGAVRVEVRDQGVGVEPAVIPHLFERFRRGDGQLDHQVSGLGLGLYVAAEVIRRQGGDIGVASEPGKGSCFWFTLPA